MDETKIPVAFCVGMLYTGECLDWSCQNVGTIEITVSDKYGTSKWACDFECPTGTKPDANGNCDCEIDFTTCEEL